MAFDKVVTGGTVVTPGGTLRADIGISGGRIETIGTNLVSQANGADEIDASGCYIIPGVVDVHTHFGWSSEGAVSSDDFRTGTRAAARGGVTSVLDFAVPRAGETLAAAAERRVHEAAAESLIDFAFHICITDWEAQRDEIEDLAKRGFTTFAEFLIDDGDARRSDDRTLFATLETMSRIGTMLLLHAESASVLDELISRHHFPDQMARERARLHARTRPNFIEAEAVQRAILWSEITSGQLYVMHMSTAESSDLVKSAQLRGVPVVAETCPPYLVLDDSVYEEDEGHLFASCPQIKTRTDSLRLWKGMRSGEVSVVSSDSRAFLREQKDAWEGDFTRIPMGLPGVETLLPVLYTHGVRFGRISLEELVRLLAANPAQIMGLYPRKGAIQVGADADLAIIHPTREMIVDPTLLETNADWSPYAGWSLAGFARTTLSRGEIIVEDYRVAGASGRGRWMPRRRAGLFGRELAAHESP